MAMIECPGCGRQISDGLERCVWCYRDMRPGAPPLRASSAGTSPAAPATQPVASAAAVGRPGVLSRCRHCGHEASLRAKACPGCGAPSPTTPPAIMALGQIGTQLTLLITVPVLVLMMFAYCWRS